MRVQTRWYALSEARMDFEFDREQVPWGKVAKYFEKRVKRIWNGRNPSIWNMRNHWHKSAKRFGCIMRRVSAMGKLNHARPCLCKLATRLGEEPGWSIYSEEYMIICVKHTCHVTLGDSRTDFTSPERVREDDRCFRVGPTDAGDWNGNHMCRDCTFSYPVLKHGSRSPCNYASTWVRLSCA